MEMWWTIMDWAFLLGEQGDVSCCGGLGESGVVWLLSELARLAA